MIAIPRCSFFARRSIRRREMNDWLDRVRSEDDERPETHGLRLAWSGRAVVRAAMPYRTIRRLSAIWRATLGRY